MAMVTEWTSPGASEAKVPLAAASPSVRKEGEMGGRRGRKEKGSLMGALKCL